MKTSQIILITALFGFSAPSYAVNWINLTSTEKPGTEAKSIIYSWFQPEWQSTDGTKIIQGDWQGQNAFGNSLRPDYDTSSGLNIFRARIGARGRINQHWNYALQTEFGNGVITDSEGSSLVVLDASLTTDLLGTNLRFGQFKNPSSEEALQAKFDYSNFAFPTALLVMESFFDGSGASTTDANLRNGSVDAFRDIGVQLFDTYKKDNWEHTWAVMLSNGNGLMRTDNNSNKDINLYWSSENIFEGKGKQQQGLKLFAWYRDGIRTLTTDGAGEYNRTRWGLGSTYKQGKWSSTVEYIDADGMIPMGTDSGAVPGSVSNDTTKVAGFNIKPEAKANGWWGDIGYRITPELETRIRYDKTNRDLESPSTAEFTNVTLGLKWFYHKQGNLIVNYEFRDLAAPEQPSTHGINVAGKGLDNRISIQLFHLFKL